MAPLKSAHRLIVTVNAGSSSVKAGLFAFGPEPELLASRTVRTLGADDVGELIRWVDEQAHAPGIAAVGHRIVHGGPRYRKAQRITAVLRDDLSRLVPFAPNHLPRELSFVDAFTQYAPGIAQFACFDTAFHQRMPEVAQRLPIPATYHERGIQRYGFHGLSYAFLIEELARISEPAIARDRVVLAHLGSGSSLAAVRDGVGIDTTMGFTPIGGLVMSTRSGDLDPGVITYLARTERLSANELEKVLSEHSGLLALSGTTGDMQELLTREDAEPAARFAVECYVYSVIKAIGAMTAALDGLDTLVFSGGIGEHASLIRARICRAFGFLGVEIDQEANARHDSLISAPTSRVTVRVIPTNEELMIARATYRASEAS